MKPLRTLSVAAAVLGLTITVVSPAVAELNDGTVVSADGMVIPCQTTLDGPYWDPDYDNVNGFPGFHSQHTFRCAAEPDLPDFAKAHTLLRLRILEPDGSWQLLGTVDRYYLQDLSGDEVEFVPYFDYKVGLSYDYCPLDGTHTYRLRARTVVIDSHGTKYLSRHLHVRDIFCDGGRP